MLDEKLVALVAGVIGVWTISVLILLVTLRLTLHVCVGISTAMVLIFLVALRRATLRFCASVRPFHILKTDQIDCEIRPPSDGVWHVLAFIWRVFGSGRLYQAFLRWLNRKYLHWDTRFEDLGQNAATEVLSYCRTYGVQVEPWVWEKSAGEYTTMNEWFTRKYAGPHAPERNLGTSHVLSPATAVVTPFPSVREMPQIIKNEQFHIRDVGIPEHEQYVEHPCYILYLAPADYHCYHAPFAGTVVSCAFASLGTHSASVKPYIYEHINVLETNRRAILVLEQAARGPAGAPPLRAVLVIIGGVTVDSIRLEAGIHEGARVERGALLGCFARGGSSIALFFNRHTALIDQCAALHAKGMDFKLEAGASLASVLGSSPDEVLGSGRHLAAENAIACTSLTRVQLRVLLERRLPQQMLEEHGLLEGIDRDALLALAQEHGIERIECDELEELSPSRASRRASASKSPRPSPHQQANNQRAGEASP